MAKKINKQNRNETRVFNSYKEFQNHFKNSLSDINGVSKEFAEKFPNYKEMNYTNKKCWNCLDCRHCLDCIECIECFRCSDCEHVEQSQDCLKCKEAIGLNICHTCWNSTNLVHRYRVRNEHNQQYKFTTEIMEQKSYHDEIEDDNVPEYVDVNHSIDAIENMEEEILCNDGDRGESISTDDEVSNEIKKSIKKNVKKTQKNNQSNNTSQNLPIYTEEEIFEMNRNANVYRVEPDGTFTHICGDENKLVEVEKEERKEKVVKRTLWRKLIDWILENH